MSHNPETSMYDNEYMSRRKAFETQNRIHLLTLMRRRFDWWPS
jgi:hypothetical protein